jgi:hypothetical protein
MSTANARFSAKKTGRGALKTGGARQSQKDGRQPQRIARLPLAVEGQDTRTANQWTAGPDYQMEQRPPNQNDAFQEAPLKGYSRRQAGGDDDFVRDVYGGIPSTFSFNK